MNALESASTRPYLIRALYEWCADNALTPYVAVHADDSVQVPREYVQNGEIVLNVSTEATSGLTIGNEFIEFKARFGGVPREIMVPVDRVLAIYARENGQGMAFPVAAPDGTLNPLADDGQAPGGVGTAAPTPGARSGIQLVQIPDGGDDDGVDPPPPASRKKPALKRIK